MPVGSSPAPPVPLSAALPQKQEPLSRLPVSGRRGGRVASPASSLRGAPPAHGAAGRRGAGVWLAALFPRGSRGFITFRGKAELRRAPQGSWPGQAGWGSRRDPGALPGEMAVISLALGSVLRLGSPLRLPVLGRSGLRLPPAERLGGLRGGRWRRPRRLPGLACLVPAARSAGRKAFRERKAGPAAWGESQVPPGDRCRPRSELRPPVRGDAGARRLGFGEARGRGEEEEGPRSLQPSPGSAGKRKPPGARAPPARCAKAG